MGSFPYLRIQNKIPSALQLHKLKFVKAFSVNVTRISAACIFKDKM